MIVIDLRDRTGTVQVMVDPEGNTEVFCQAEQVRNETVLRIGGGVRPPR